MQIRKTNLPQKGMPSGAQVPWSQTRRAGPNSSKPLSQVYEATAPFPKFSSEKVTRPWAGDPGKLHDWPVKGNGTISPPLLHFYSREEVNLSIAPPHIHINMIIIGPSSSVQPIHEIRCSTKLCSVTRSFVGLIRNEEVTEPESHMKPFLLTQFSAKICCLLAYKEPRASVRWLCVPLHVIIGMLYANHMWCRWFWA